MASSDKDVSAQPTREFMIDPLTVTGLTTTGCRARQQRLCHALQRQGLDAALLGDRRHVYYFTGFWQRSIYSPLALVESDGRVALTAPLEPPTPTAADECLVYEADRLGTLIDDQWTAALDTLKSRLAKSPGLGTDLPCMATGDGRWNDLRPLLWRLRRHKDPDEVDLIRCAIAATDAAYAFAQTALRPGITEVELFAGMLATIAEAVGEPIGEIGNDFQIGSPGGLPRRRAAESGEVAVLDISVVVRGYTSDLCRSFVVGGEPSELQLVAHQRIGEVFRDVEAALCPGADCRSLFEMAAEKLKGYRGWTFGHHLGHGIGLSAHEAPRLNPHWTDALEVGDVFTLEPGLYGDDLRAGLRIEHDYYLSEAGLERLSQFPIELA